MSRSGSVAEWGGELNVRSLGVFLESCVTAKVSSVSSSSLCFDPVLRPFQAFVSILCSRLMVGSEWKLRDDVRDCENAMLKC